MANYHTQFSELIQHLMDEEIEWLKVEFAPPDSLTYANTCSKLRYNEFSGGLIFITANNIRFLDAVDQARKLTEQFATRKANKVLRDTKKKKVLRRGKKNHRRCADVEGFEV